jgi:hypothetical protein
LRMSGPQASVVVIAAKQVCLGLPTDAGRDSVG